MSQAKPLILLPCEPFNPRAIDQRALGGVEQVGEGTEWARGMASSKAAGIAEANAVQAIGLVRPPHS